MTSNPTDSRIGSNGHRQVVVYVAVLVLILMLSTHESGEVQSARSVPAGPFLI
jgi:hypothetical protein